MSKINKYAIVLFAIAIFVFILNFALVGCTESGDPMVSPRDNFDSGDTILVDTEIEEEELGDSLETSDEDIFQLRHWKAFPNKKSKVYLDTLVYFVNKNESDIQYVYDCPGERLSVYMPMLTSWGPVTVDFHYNKREVCFLQVNYQGEFIDLGEFHLEENRTYELGYDLDGGFHCEVTSITGFVPCDCNEVICR